MATGSPAAYNGNLDQATFGASVFALGTNCIKTVNHLRIASVHKMAGKAVGADATPLTTAFPVPHDMLL